MVSCATLWSTGDGVGPRTTAMLFEKHFASEDSDTVGNTVTPSSASNASLSYAMQWRASTVPHTRTYMS